MKKLTAFLSAYVVLFVVIGFAHSSQAPKEIKLPAKMVGDITFNHEMHSSELGIACNDCHHTGTEGSEVKCANCHKDQEKEGVPSLKIAAHNSCWKCHSEKPKEGGQISVKCSVCHVKSK